MTCSLILTANAGVCLRLGDKSILIDSLHDEKQPDFSAVPPGTLEEIWARFANESPTLVMATHDHPDHVSHGLWEKARGRWPDSFFLSPGPSLGGSLTLTERRLRLSVDGLHIDAMRLRHVGAGYEDTVNYGFFLEYKGFSVLDPGDSDPDGTEGILELIAGRRVDLALLNFPWATMTKPREFVRDVLAPRHLALIHLPFARDDRYGYIRAARKAIEKMPFGMDVRVLSEPLDTTDIEN